MHRKLRVFLVSSLIVVGMTMATAAFAEKDTKAGYPWGPFDDECVSTDVCL